MQRRCHLHISAKDVYKPEKEPTGFFPPAHTAQQGCDSGEEKAPIKPDCYVPNSVLLRLLWPPKELEATQNPEKEYRPPGMTEEQMKQIAALNEKVNDAFQIFFHTGVGFYLLYTLIIKLVMGIAVKLLFCLCFNYAKCKFVSCLSHTEKGRRSRFQVSIRDCLLHLSLSKAIIQFRHVPLHLY